MIFTASLNASSLHTYNLFLFILLYCLITVKLKCTINVYKITFLNNYFSLVRTEVFNLLNWFFKLSEKPRHVFHNFPRDHTIKDFWKINTFIIILEDFVLIRLVRKNKLIWRMHWRSLISSLKIISLNCTLLN